MSTVIIERLRKEFGSHVVLPNFDLRIEEGEFVALLGPSGCGKTTVLRCLAGLERPTDGRIVIGDDVVHDEFRRISLPTQKRGLGLVFQSYALWPHMNVFENVAYPLRVRRASRDSIFRKTADMLELVGLDGLAERAPAELSGGQQQRVALARALIASPRVLLLDEPLSNLDAQLRERLRKQLRRIHREVRTTSVYVTHDQVEALTMADRVVVMNKGRIEQSGTPREVFERPASRFVADFLGYENIIRGRVVSASGRAVTIQSDDWGGNLQVESDKRLAIGTIVDIAFRAASVQVHDGAGHNDNALPNKVAATIRDVTFLGDCIEYTLSRGTQQIVSRLPARANNHAEPGAPDEKRQVSIRPADIVLLASGEASNVLELPRRSETSSPLVAHG
jgi:iron(III) transport system ATP-binding protein